jgi:hypothetical protein
VQKGESSRAGEEATEMQMKELQKFLREKSESREENKIVKEEILEILRKLHNAQETKAPNVALNLIVAIALKVWDLFASYVANLGAARTSANLDK